MDSNTIYVKTASGDEAVRQSTRVVQRFLRMMLVQIDGKLSVAELSAKIGNPQRVEAALSELAAGGFISPATNAVSIWEDGESLESAPDSASQMSRFSAFGKPILATGMQTAGGIALPEPEREPVQSNETTESRKTLIKRVAGGVVFLVFCLLASAVFYPYNQLKATIEASAARLLGAPVHISHVGLSLWPLPHLSLTELTIGEPVDSRIESIHLFSPTALLGGGVSVIPRVDVAGATFSANRLVALPLLGFPAGVAGANVSFRQVQFAQTRVTANDLVLEDISGEILFKPDGGVEKSSFLAVDRSIHLEAMPTAQGLLLKIEAMGWEPVGSKLSLGLLQAKGLLQKNKLLIESLDATLLGGSLRGNFLLDWRKGLVMAGDASLSHLDCQKLSAAFAPTLKLQGDLGGALRIRAGGHDWADMWRNVEATLDADITRGVFHGVDLGEAARRGGGAMVRSGDTKFDRLRSSVTINPLLITGKDLQMEAGMLTASGGFVANREGKLDSDLMVSLHASVGSQHIPIRVMGVLPQLTAGSRR